MFFHDSRGNFGLSTQCYKVTCSAMCISLVILTDLFIQPMVIKSVTTAVTAAVATAFTQMKAELQTFPAGLFHSLLSPPQGIRAQHREL